MLQAPWHLGDSIPAISGVSRRQCELQVLGALGALPRWD